jgi:hypothetical protein
MITVIYDESSSCTFPDLVAAAGAKLTAEDKSAIPSRPEVFAVRMMSAVTKEDDLGGEIRCLRFLYPDKIMYPGMKFCA